MGDRASDNLFTFVDPEVFRRPTFHTFRALMDNYTRETGDREVVTHTETKASPMYHVDHVTWCHFTFQASN